MSDNITLELRVVTNEVAKGEQELKKLGAAAKDAQKDLEGVGNGAKGMSGGLGDAAQRTQVLKDLLGRMGEHIPGIGQVSSAFGNVASAGSNAMTKIGGVAGALGGVVAVGGAAYLALEGVASMARAAADEADEMAQKMGTTIERMETLRLIAQENGGSLEGLQKVFDKVAKSVNKLDEENEKTQQSFQALGLDIKEIGALSEQEIAGRVIHNWETLGRTSQATAAAMAVLGPGFRDQIPAIKAAAEEMDGYTERVRSFGADATPDLVAAGGKQEVAMSNLGLAWKGLANETARWTGAMMTSMTSWAATAINKIRSVLAEFRQSQAVVNAQVSAVAAVPQDRRNALLKQARDETYTPGNVNATEHDVNKRFRELLRLEDQAALKAKERAGYTEQNAAAEQNILDLKLRQSVAAAGAGRAVGGGAGRSAGRAARPPRARSGGAGASAPKAAESGIAGELLAEEKALAALRNEYLALYGVEKQTLAQQVELEIQAGKFAAKYNERGQLVKRAATEEELAALRANATMRDTLAGINERARAEIRLNDLRTQATANTDRSILSARQELEQARIRNQFALDLTKTQGDLNIALAQYNQQQAQAALDLAVRNGAKEEELIKLREELRLRQALVNVAVQGKQDETANLNAAGANNTFEAGWARSFDRYKKDAEDAAKTGETMFASMSNNMASAFDTFLTTGKFSFKDFTKAILRDIGMIIAKKLILKALGGLFGDGASFGTSSTGFEPGLASTVGMSLANGGAFNTAGVKFFASGDVFNSPTAFRYNGGKLGVMGEAGPEAVMPLTRGPDGRLGVQAQGGGAQVIAPSYSVQVVVQGNASEKDANTIAEATIRAIAKQEVARSSRAQKRAVA